MKSCLYQKIIAAVLVLTTCFVAVAQEELQTIHYLQEVFVDAPIVYQKGDTLVYRAEALTAKTDRVLEDILKRIPGVTVESNGSIKYNGKPINNFYIEGLDLLSSRYSLATQHIRPEDIKNIEVLENHQHVKLLKGVEFSDRAAINIRLKKNRLSHPIGYAQAGIGTGVNDFEDMVGAQIMNIAKENQYLVTAGQRAHWAMGSRSQNLFDDNVARFSNVYSPFDQTIISRPDIQSKRYLDNENLHAQANVMRRTKHGNEIRFIADVSMDDDYYAQSQHLDYYSEGNLIREITDFSSDTRKKNAQMQFRLERNLDSLYIKHSSTLSFSRSRNKSDLADKGQQDLRNDNFAYYGDVSLIKKTKQRVLQLDGGLSVEHLPATMSYMHLTQDYKSTGFSAFVNTGYQYSFTNAYSAGVSLNISADNNRLKSELSEAVGTTPDYAFANDCHLLDISVKASPFFQIKKMRSDFKLTVPIEYTYLKGDNRRQDIGFTDNLLNIGLDIKGTVKLTPLARIISQISYTRWQGSVSELAVAPIQTSYIEQSALGSGKLSSHNRGMASLEYAYRHPITGLSINLQANVQRLSSDVFTGSYYDEGGFISYTVNSHNNSYSQQYLASITENLFDIEWILSLHGLYVYRLGKTMQRDRIYEITSPMYSLNFKSEKFFWDRRLSLENSISYTHNESSYQLEGSSQADTKRSDAVLSNKNNLRISLAKKWFLAIHSDSQWRKASGWHPNHYIDASMGWKSKEHEIELCGNNLTNNSVWSSTHYTGLNSYYYTYSLRALEVMLSYKYNF